MHPAAALVDEQDHVPVLREFFGRPGMTDEQVGAEARIWLTPGHPMLSNPFVTQPTRRLRFGCDAPAGEVARYCRDALRAMDWARIPGSEGMPCPGCRVHLAGRYRNGRDVLKLTVYEPDDSAERGACAIVFVFVDPDLPARLGLAQESID